MWSLTFREEHKLQVFEIKVLRKIFGPKKDDISRLRFCIMRDFVIYTGHLITMLR